MATKPSDKPTAKVAVADPAEFEIRTPFRTFRGKRFGIQIIDGFGRTTDAQAAQDCISAGYEVKLPDGTLKNPLPAEAS